MKRRTLALLLLVTLFTNMRFRKNDNRVESYFDDKGIPVSIQYVNIHGDGVRCIQTSGKDPANLVVFVHGAPGSSKDFYAYLADSALLANAVLIAYDRPGYGFSGFGKSQVNIQHQARVLAEIVRLQGGNRFSKTVLVGHSYGGPVAVRMAMDNPLLVDCAVLLAPAVDPAHEKEVKMAKWAQKAPIRWMTPKVWRVAADEKYAHKDELKEMVPFWDSLNAQIVHLHGNKDKIVPYENLAFVREKVPAARFTGLTLDGENHFIPWTQKDTIVAIIKKVLED